MYVTNVRPWTNTFLRLTRKVMGRVRAYLHWCTYAGREAHTWRWASYVTGTISGRDVYVHALHAFLERFLHREAPQWSGKYLELGYLRTTTYHLSLFHSHMALLVIEETLSDGNLKYEKYVFYFIVQLIVEFDS